jgi:transcriptional regulator with XRE-family HTH domain
MSVNQDTDYVIRNHQSFGRALREFCSCQGITQGELAQRLDVYRSYPSALEGGSTTEVMRRIVVVAQALDLEIVVLPPSPKNKVDVEFAVLLDGHQVAIVNERGNRMMMVYTDDTGSLDAPLVSMAVPVGIRRYDDQRARTFFRRLLLKG